jgi:hypothetical protein
MGEYDAETCFSKSAKILTDAEIEVERARTLRDWAKYKLNSGDHEQGRKLWEEAREIFSELGARMEVERMNIPPG